MAVSWRPLVVGGLSVAGSIWLLDGFTHLLGDWLPAIVLGSGGVWAYLKFQDGVPILGPTGMRQSAVNRSAVQTALSTAESIVNQYAAEIQDLSSDGSAQKLSDLRSQLHQILSELDRDEIRLAVIGGPAVGKTTLTELLQTGWAAELAQITLQDTPALFAANAGQDWQGARAADLILFLTDGDLTATQLQALQQIHQSHRRLVVVLNKQDQHLPAALPVLLAQVRDRVVGLVRSEDVVAIAAAPRPTKVRQHQPDGSVQEWLEEAVPEVQGLTDRLSQILLQEGQSLVLASALGEAEALQAAAAVQLNAVRRERALPILDKAQWIVAGTAFANPFPALDLLATAAINGQMVIELSQLYQQKFSLNQGKTIATTLAGLMVKLGLVEVSTQAIGALLKTNLVTYVAGGLLQGVSGAYLTRLAGLTLIEYFEAESGKPLAPDQLEKILRSVFQQNQRLSFLQGFVQQAAERLLAKPVASPARIEPLEWAGLPPAQDAQLQIPLHLAVAPKTAQPLALPENWPSDDLFEERMMPMADPVAKLEASL
jgi:uncharacterized protein